MKLNWLQDVLALARCGSLTEAAAEREVTQPAFSRRLRALESWLGTEVLDRSRKAAQLTPAVAAHLEGFESLVRDFYRLRNEVRAWQRGQGRLVFVAQHSLSMSYLPRLITELQSERGIAGLRLRAANMNDCYNMLLRHEADILVGYSAASVTMPLPDDSVQRLELARDLLQPVVAASIAGRVAGELRERRPLGVIGYPQEVFLGVLFHQDILPALTRRQIVQVLCETALAPGVMELTLEGLGVGWLPRSLASAHLAAGRLVALPQLGSIELGIMALRLRTNGAPTCTLAWEALGRLAGREAAAGGTAAPQ